MGKMCQDEALGIILALAADNTIKVKYLRPWEHDARARGLREAEALAIVRKMANKLSEKRKKEDDQRSSNRKIPETL